MLQTLQCPNCHAPLEYNPAQSSPTVRCDYCSSVVVVPENLRGAGLSPGASLSSNQEKNLNEARRLLDAGRKIEAIKLIRETFDIGLKEAKDLVEALEQQETIWIGNSAIHVSHLTSTEQTQAVKLNRNVGCLVLGALVVVVLGVLIPILLTGGLTIFGISRVSELANQPEVVTVIEATLEQEKGVSVETEPEATPGFALLIAQFGQGEGIGPGFFDDTRRLGIDGDGNIYTGDYSSGRIQVFDAKGEFLATWQVNPELSMVGMTVDRQGMIYIVESSLINRYNGMTGEPAGQIGDGTTHYRGLTTASDGSLVAYAPDRLTRWDAQGNVIWDLHDPFADIPDFQTTHEDLAVDGAGQIYLTGSETIYVFDANGRYLNRLGSKGDADDQFRTSPTAVAVDGQGRVYANDFDGIKVFDRNGRYLDTITYQGVTFDMTFNDDNQLVVMNRNGNEVLIYEINQ